MARMVPNSESSATTCSHLSALRELMITSAPACSRPRAIITPPMPLLPPVTRAVFPDSPNSLVRSASLNSDAFRSRRFQNRNEFSSGNTRKSVSVISVSRP